MNNKQQTAVDFLVECFEKIIGKSIVTVMSEKIHQAKQLEKQQIIDAYNQDLYGGLSNNRKFENGEQYYKENYGND